MKKIIPAVFASVLALGVASAFAAPIKVVPTNDLTGLYPASVTVGLVGSPEQQFKEVLTPHSAVANVRIPSFALGAVDSTKLGNALQIMSVNARTGITVAFKDEQSRAVFDQLDFYVFVAQGTKAGTYPVTVNVHNPLTGTDGAVTLNVVVQ
jgi:hypothetical protein